MADEKNIWLRIAYDGTLFCGWQRQPGKRTVCGELEAQLSVLCGCPVKLSGTSRTDGGVHALGQCASFKAPISVPADRLARVLNDRLAKDRLEGVGDIRILEARQMPEAFHARFDSKGKRYIYKVYNCPVRDIFRRNYCYQVSDFLDLEAMNEAALYIAGEHDFAGFMSTGSTPQESTVRTVYSLKAAAEETEGGRLVTITAEGNGFLYNMVRIITGTLVEAGLHKRTPQSVKAAVEKAQRSLAGHTAPPQGLYLAKVFYGKDYFPDDPEAK